MIPYFQLTSFSIGPATIYVWGLLVAAGLLAATALLHYLARKFVLSPAVAMDLAVWALVGGFVGARVSHVVFYEPTYYLQNPTEILKIWHGGLSSLGGFIGAAVALRIFMAVRRFSWKDFLPYADIASVSLWLGWGIGRIGCFLIHDHPGTLSHFMLAVNYPALIPCNLPGGTPCFMPRHDLGLYDSLLGFALFAISWFLLPRLLKKRFGLTAAISFLLYAGARFFLDFLRATDIPNSDLRYGEFTPAQWGMVAVIFILTGSLAYATLKRTNTEVRS